jgi:hypothetical protein
MDGGLVRPTVWYARVHLQEELMQINRSRFLALSAAIAAAASCTATSTTNNVTPPADGGGGNQDTGVTTNPVDGSSGDDTATAADSADAAPGCDDLSVGSFALCAQFGDGGTDGGDDGGSDASSSCLTDLVCNGSQGNLKPEVAAAVVACVNAQTTCNVGDCIKAAAQGTTGPGEGGVALCTDSTAQATCDQINAACADAGADAGVTNADCTSIVTHLTAAGRTALVACMTASSCSAPNVESCLSTLF